MPVARLPAAEAQHSPSRIRAIRLLFLLLLLLLRPTAWSRGARLEARVVLVLDPPETLRLLVRAHGVRPDLGLLDDVTRVAM